MKPIKTNTSNCILKALEQKIRNPSNKIYIVIPKDKTERGIPHFIWKIKNGEYYHFTFEHKRKMNKWYKFVLFKGYIEKFPLQFLKQVTIKKVI
jgi:hypothetical protein